MRGASRVRCDFVFDHIIASSGRPRIRGTHFIAPLWSRPSLAGTLPPSFWNLTGLTYLDLSHNWLYGTLPVAITQFTNIRTAYFNNNYFQGDFVYGALSSALYLRNGSFSYNRRAPPEC